MTAAGNIRGAWGRGGILAVLGLALALAGCSSGEMPTDGQSTLVRALGDRALASAQSRGQRESAVPTVRPGQRVRVDPSVIAGVTVPVLLAHIEDRGTVATLARGPVSNGVATWRSPDAVSLSLRSEGLLIATRGLGRDLMIADVTATEQALRTGGGRDLRRVHRQLDDLLQLLTLEYRCTVQLVERTEITIAGRDHMTLRFEESCIGVQDPTDRFVNSYWRDPNRMFIWQSRQRISDGVGVINLQRLVE